MVGHKPLTKSEWELLFGRQAEAYESWTEQDTLNNLASAAYTNNIVPVPGATIQTDIEATKSYPLLGIHKPLSHDIRSKRGVEKAKRVIELMDARVLGYHNNNLPMTEQAMLWYLKRLDFYDRAIVYRHIERLADRVPIYKRFFEDWESLCRIADGAFEKYQKGEKLNLRYKYFQGIYSPLTSKATVKVWQCADQSIPLLLGDDVWFVRLMFNVSKRKFYFDIRRFDKREEKGEVSYVPSDEGLSISIDEGIALFNSMSSILGKWKAQITKIESRQAK